MASGFRVIAHRGASASAPENTLVAFETAQAMGATEIELDIRLSRDGELFVFHDESLDQKTNLAGPVRTHTAATLHRAEIGSWYDRRHPDQENRFAGTCLTDLDAVFALFEEAFHYHIEIKEIDDALPPSVLQKLVRFGLRDRVTVSSFALRPLEQLHSLAPDLVTCLLVHDRPPGAKPPPEQTPREASSSTSKTLRQRHWMERAAAAGCRQVGLRAGSLTEISVPIAEALGLEVRGWGIRTESDLLEMRTRGAIGATVDWPDRALKCMQEARAAPGRSRRQRQP